MGINVNCKHFDRCDLSCKHPGAKRVLRFFRPECKAIFGSCELQEEYPRPAPPPAPPRADSYAR